MSTAHPVAHCHVMETFERRVIGIDSMLIRQQTTVTKVIFLLKYKSQKINFIVLHSAPQLHRESNNLLIFCFLRRPVTLTTQ